MAKIRQKTKKLRYKWIFGDRKSLIPKKISKKFEFKAKTWAKMTKNKTILSQNWSFRAKNWPKIAKKKKEISKKFEFKAKTGAK